MTNPVLKILPPNMQRAIEKKVAQEKAKQRIIEMVKEKSSIYKTPKGKAVIDKMSSSTYVPPSYSGGGGGGSGGGGSGSGGAPASSTVIETVEPDVVSTGGSGMPKQDFVKMVKTTSFGDTPLGQALVRDVISNKPGSVFTTPPTSVPKTDFKPSSKYNLDVFDSQKYNDRTVTVYYNPDFPERGKEESLDDYNKRAVDYVLKNEDLPVVNRMDEVTFKPNQSISVTYENKAGEIVTVGTNVNKFSGFKSQIEAEGGNIVKIVGLGSQGVVFQQPTSSEWDAAVNRATGYSTVTRMGPPINLVDENPVKTIPVKARDLTIGENISLLFKTGEAIVKHEGKELISNLGAFPEYTDEIMKTSFGKGLTGKDGYLKPEYITDYLNKERYFADASSDPFAHINRQKEAWVTGRENTRAAIERGDWGEVGGRLIANPFVTAGLTMGVSAGLTTFSSSMVGSQVFLGGTHAAFTTGQYISAGTGVLFGIPMAAGLYESSSRGTLSEDVATMAFYTPTMIGAWQTGELLGNIYGPRIGQKIGTGLDKTTARARVISNTIKTTARQLGSEVGFRGTRALYRTIGERQTTALIDFGGSLKYGAGREIGAFRQDIVGIKTGLGNTYIGVSTPAKFKYGSFKYGIKQDIISAGKFIQKNADVRMAKNTMWQYSKQNILLPDELTIGQRAALQFSRVKSRLLEPTAYLTNAKYIEKQNILGDVTTRIRGYSTKFMSVVEGRQPFGKTTIRDYTYWRSQQLPSEYQSFWMGKQPIIDVDLQLRSLGIAQRGKYIFTEYAFKAGKPGVLVPDIKEAVVGRYTRYPYERTKVYNASKAQEIWGKYAYQKGTKFEEPFWFFKQEAKKLMVKVDESQIGKKFYMEGDRTSITQKELFGRYAFSKDVSSPVVKNKLIPTINDKRLGNYVGRYTRYPYERTKGYTNKGIDLGHWLRRTRKTTGGFSVIKPPTDFNATQWEIYHRIKDVGLPDIPFNEIITGKGTTSTLKSPSVSTSSKSKPFKQYEWYQKPSTKINWDAAKYKPEWVSPGRKIIKIIGGRRYEIFIPYETGIETVSGKWAITKPVAPWTTLAPKVGYDTLLSRINRPTVESEIKTTGVSTPTTTRLFAPTIEVPIEEGLLINVGTGIGELGGVKNVGNYFETGIGELGGIKLDFSSIMGEKQEIGLGEETSIKQELGLGIGLIQNIELAEVQKQKLDLKQELVQVQLLKPVVRPKIDYTVIEPYEPYLPEPYTPRKPRIKIPKFPKFPEGGEAKRKTLVKTTKKAGYDVYVKERSMFGGKVIKGTKFKKITSKPVDRSTALAIGGDITDNSAAISFKIKKTKDKAIKSSRKIKPWSAIKHKFKKKGEVYIEQNPYRIDSSGEVKEITKRGKRSQILGSKKKGRKKNVRYF